MSHAFVLRFDVQDCLLRAIREYRKLRSKSEYEVINYPIEWVGIIPYVASNTVAPSLQHTTAPKSHTEQFLLVFNYRRFLRCWDSHFRGAITLEPGGVMRLLREIGSFALDEDHTWRLVADLTEYCFRVSFNCTYECKSNHSVSCIIFLSWSRAELDPSVWSHPHIN